MKRFVIGVVLLIVVAFTGLMVSEYQQESKPVFNNASDFTTAINTERAKRDLEPVTDNKELVFIAEAKCSDMVTRHYTAHQDPDGNYIWDKAPQGFKYGENLAGGFYNSYETVQHWIASPEHLANIVDPAFTQIGHATCYDGKQFLVVQVFKS